MDANHHMRTTSPRRPRWRRAARLLLVIPFIGTLWVATYASLTPELWGIPFFYWYQFLWIAIGAVLTIIVYLVEHSADPSSGDEER
jgi:peptidoglycan/LPS O-acetylase OafA/YrhL